MTTKTYMIITSMFLRFLLMGVLVLLLSSCVSMKPRGHSLQYVDGQEVVIYRSTSFIGGGAKLFINLNGESLTLYPWTEHKVILQPGTHVITKDRGTDLIGMPMNLGLLKESLTFVVNDGESIKIGVSFNNPFVFDRLNSRGGLINRNPMYAASDARRGAPDRIAGKIASPPAEQSTQTEPPRSTLSLTAAASQVDANGVVTLTISTNSDTASLKVNGDETGGRSDGRYTVKRFAQVGDNKYEVIATDRFGNTQRQTVSVNRAFEQTAERIDALSPLFIPAVKPRDAVAIIIGIEKYRSVSSADFANRDASIFVDYATRALGIPTQNIRLLVDEKAGAAEILLTFKNWFPTRVNKGKTDVYVFYSGHGLPSEDGSSLYFLPHDANRELLDRTAITQKELVDALQRASPKTVTMFIDSCYSGQTRTGETLLASARPIAVAAKQATSFPPNFTVLSASAPDQISSSSPDLKHGIFSYYLMRGMEGEADSNKDKQITVGEMQAYLAENVTKRALGMSRTQQPQVVGDQSRVLVGR